MSTLLKVARPVVARRAFSLSGFRRILSQQFRLDQEWQARHKALGELNLGGDYEWIAAVQKKYVGGGKASVVDVDAAACLSEESDQLHDIIDLVYKLRHTENAADMLPSTEYALYRLTMKHEAIDELFKILNDPINYGVFPNYHISALLIDFLLKRENVVGAAKVATIVMQQEMFDNEFLNLLALYSLARFLELPIEQQLFDEKIQKVWPAIDPDEINEEDLRTMKFPFLKEKFNDNHFDLEETIPLVAKSIQWLLDVSRNSLDGVSTNSLQAQLYLLQNDWENFEKFAAIGLPITEGTAKTVLERLQKAIAALPEEGREESDDFKKLNSFIAKIEASPKEKGDLSEYLLTKINSIKETAEANLMEEQKKMFTEWNKTRKERVMMQAERLNLRLRIEEIKAEMKEHNDRKEELFFFENRVNWEDRATEKDKLYEEFNLNKKDETVTEAEYAKTMFEKAIASKQKQSTA